jgi:ATP-dependent protease ClpP protease subunit
MEAQLAAEAAARTAAITQAQDMADKARLLESQVEALNQAAAEATHRLQASLKQMEASHAVWFSSATRRLCQFMEILSRC